MTQFLGDRATFRNKQVGRPVQVMVQRWHQLYLQGLWDPVPSRAWGAQMSVALTSVHSLLSTRMLPLEKNLLLGSRR